MKGGPVSRGSRPPVAWTSTGLGRPEDVTSMDEGQLAVTDTQQGVVNIFTPSGNPRKISPQVTYKGRFEPLCLAHWPGRGLLMSRVSCSDLLMASVQGDTWDTFPVDTVSDNVFSPFGLAVFSNTQHFVITHCNGLISLHDKYGVLAGKICSPGMNWYVSADESKQRILVSDCLNHCVKIFSSDGELLRQFGKEGHSQGRFRAPRGVCSDHLGNIFVADGQNSRVSMFSPDGRFISQVLDYRDGLSYPRGMAMDSTGRLAVAWQRKVSCWSLGETCTMSDTVSSATDTSEECVTRL